MGCYYTALDTNCGIDLWCRMPRVIDEVLELLTHISESQILAPVHKLLHIANYDSPHIYCCYSTFLEDVEKWREQESQYFLDSYGLHCRCCIWKWITFIQVYSFYHWIWILIYFKHHTVST